jgi:OOP family OmpA-OmpF porin
MNFNLHSVFKILLFCFFACRLPAQTAAKVNLIPNPGFETFDGFPIGWYYKGQDFTDVMAYWSSPTGASPDAYGPKVHVPESWAKKGFGKMIPHGGAAMAGITLYGCANGKPHCKEYIQIQLREPLVVNQIYVFEIWVASIVDGLYINNLGVAFNDKSTTLITDERLKMKPVILFDKIIVPPVEGWKKLTAKFTAATESEWLIIGNFFDDPETQVQGVSPLNFAYYYIDDVSLKKIEPILQPPVKDVDILKIKLEIGKTIVLKNIYFDSDKSNLQSSSSNDLEKLLKIMLDNPSLEIEIVGHTDNIGTPEYNMELSRKRAQQVVDYLEANDIASARLRFSGKGATQPIAPNDIEESRQKNRRVEFVVLKINKDVKVQANKS